MFDIPRRTLSINDTDDPRIEHRSVTLWLEPEREQVHIITPAKSQVPEEQVRKFRELCHRELMANCANGTYISPAQKEGNVSGMQRIHFGGRDWPRANMIGLTELNKLGLLPAGDEGEAYCLEVRVGNRGIARAAFADSVGAARRWWYAWLEQSGVREVIDGLNWPEDKRRLVLEFDVK